jgi:hypothetical protein
MAQAQKWSVFNAVCLRTRLDSRLFLVLENPISSIKCCHTNSKLRT